MQTWHLYNNFNLRQRFAVITRLFQPRLAKFFIFVLILIGFVSAYQHSALGYWLSPQVLASRIDQLRLWQQQLGGLGPLAFYLAASLVIVLNVPTALVIAIAAVLYGPLGAIVLGTTSFASAIALMYVIAKSLNQGLAQRLVSRYLPRFHNYLQGTNLRAIIYIRLIFFALPPVNWMLAILCTEFRSYFWGSLLGAFPNIVVFSWIGGTLIETLRQNRSLLFWKNPELITPTLVGVAFIVGSILLRKIKLTSPNT